MKKIVLMTLLLIGSMTNTVHSYSNDTYIPVNAPKLLPLVRSEVNNLHPGYSPAFMAGSIEVESCISLKHRRCWSATSSFKTKWKNGRRREHGQGLAMMTRTWRKDGTLRFDTLTRLTTKYRTRLKGLNWTTIASRGDLQIRAMALLFMEDYNKIGDNVGLLEREAMASSAYNSGYGRLSRTRRTCKIKRNCNPNKWWGNVEMVKAPGYATRILYGKRTAWMVNRDHVRHVMKHRKQKYARWYAANPVKVKVKKEVLNINSVITPTTIDIVIPKPPPCTP